MRICRSSGGEFVPLCEADIRFLIPAKGTVYPEIVAEYDNFCLGDSGRVIRRLCTVCEPRHL
jgi:hypothetical protein